MSEHLFQDSLRQMERQITRATWTQLGLARTELLEQNPDSWVIGHDSPATVEMLNMRLLRPFERAVAAVTGESISLKFVLTENNPEPEIFPLSDRLIIRDSRGGKWFFIDNLLLRGPWGRQLGPFGIAVYAALCLHAGNNNQKSWASYQTLAHLTGMSRRQAIREIKKLEQLSLIHVERRTSRSNIISLLHHSEWKL